MIYEPAPELLHPLYDALDILTRDDPEHGEPGIPIFASRHTIGYAAILATGNGVGVPPLEDMPEMPVRRTVAQNLGILEICGQYGFQSEAIHYQVHLGNLAQQFVDAQTVEEQTAVRSVIGAMYDAVSERSQVAFIEGLGFALGESYLEAESSRLWQSQVDRRIESLDAPQYEKNIVHAALTETVSPGVDLSRIKEVLHRTPLLDVDVSALQDTMTRYDIESLVGKSAEIMDYLQSRMQRIERPAEVWLQCEKALSFYAPFLFLCGYNEMAAELQGLAHEFFYDDNKVVRTEARKQWELSQQYQSTVDEIMQTTVAHAFDEANDGPITLKSRVKSLGSYERKMADAMERHSGTNGQSGLDEAEQPVRISDGIASRIIMQDSVFNEVSAKAIAARVKEALSTTCLNMDYTIFEWHMSGKPERDYVNEPKSNGYEAYHLNYILQFEDGTQVPFEIQIVGHEKDQINTHGTASHVVGYKGPGGGTDTNRNLEYRTLDQLFRFKGRSQHLDRDKLRPAEDIYGYHTAINPHMLPLLLRAFPELPTPLHEVYALNDHGHLVPPELADVPIEFSDVEAPQTMFLPPNRLNVEQFKFMVGLLDTTFRNDPDIQKAIEWVVQLDADDHATERRDKSSVLEGHLLPTAYYAALLASASGRRYSTNQDEVQFMKTTIISALLHDAVEDHYLGDRQQGLDAIRHMFSKTELDSEEIMLGNAVAELVDVLTLPEFDDEVERRTNYSKQLTEQLDGAALFIKLADRMSNHTNDLVQLINLKDEAIPTSEKREKLGKITRYFMKTDRYLTKHFDSLKAYYPAYGYVRALVWTMRDNILNSVVPTIR